MRADQWETLKKCANLQPVEPLPVALIIDSPWLPGYAGISTLDYFSLPEVWLESNLRVAEEFPEVIFLPGWWLEYGMAAEPSGYGARVGFYADKTPVAHALISSTDQVGQLPQPDPRQDGLMPLVINLYRRLEPRVQAHGYHIKMVAARGPLALATHLMGVTNFLLGLKLDPINTHRLLANATQLVKDWLSAQGEALSEVESIMLLDDIVGFLSPADYQEFAHPYLLDILSAFPGLIKVFHNDMDNPSSYPFLADLGVQIFNFTHLKDIARVRALVGDRVCLMGNVAPLDVLAKGTPGEVYAAAKGCLDSHPAAEGLILSIGGGTSMGTPAENIRALVAAARGAALAADQPHPAA